MLFTVASLALSAISSANAAAAANSSTKQTKDTNTPFQLRNNHRRAVAKEMQQQQQHTSFDSSSLSSTSNMINTKDSSGGDDDTKFKDPLKSVDEGVLSAKVPYNYKDHPLHLASPSRRLDDNSPVCKVDGVETDFIDCDNGVLADGSSGTTCAEACAALSSGTCCEGDDACVGFTGKICPDGSCIGGYACFKANIGRIVNGCKAGSKASGSYACIRAGYGGNGPGYVESVIDSCHGSGSCNRFASSINGNGGTAGNIESSCLGDNSCRMIAYSYKGNAGSVGILTDSCLGDNSCRMIAYSFYGNGGTAGNIESSCLGDNSCQMFAYSFKGNGGTVGNIKNSCDGSFSCFLLSYGYDAAGNVGDITCSCQGDGSCQKLYSDNGRANALSIDDGLSFCCNGANECSETGGIITLPATCAPDDYTDAGDSTCSVPTSSPSQSPSKAPTGSPSKEPTSSPSEVPTSSPSQSPSKAPTESPSKEPTTTPSQSPSKAPSKAPSLSSSINPSKAPTESPSKVPTSSPSIDPLSPSGPAYDNEIKATVSVESTNSNGCTSKADLLSLFEPLFCDGLSTTTCVATVENYKCIEPTTTGRKLFRAGRELSNDVYITSAEFRVTAITLCSSPCTEAKAQSSLDDVKAALEDNIAGINIGNDITISLDEIIAPLIEDVVRFYPKSWTGGNGNDEYCSNDGDYPHWMEMNIFLPTLEACCKKHFGWDSSYEDCITNGGGSPDVGDNKFYAHYLNEYCVQNCLEGSDDVACTNPGGLKTSQPTYTTAEDCCVKTLWWIESGKCAFKSRTPDEVYVYQGSGKWYPNKDWKDCVQDSTENPMPHWSAHNSHVDLDSCCKTHFSTLEEEGNDGNCPQAKFYGDDNED